MDKEEDKPQDITPPETTPDKKGGQGDDQNPAWLPDRLKQAQKSATDKLLKSSGFATVDELTAFVEAGRKAQQAQMTESERLKADLAQAAKERDEAKALAATMLAARQLDKIEGALKAAASKAKAENADDVIMLLEKAGKIDPAKLLDDKGEVKDDVIKALIEDAKKDRPAWFGRSGVGSPSNAGGRAADANDQGAISLKGKRIIRM